MTASATCLSGPFAEIAQAGAAINSSSLAGRYDRCGDASASRRAKQRFGYPHLGSGGTQFQVAFLDDFTIAVLLCLRSCAGHSTADEDIDGARFGAVHSYSVSIGVAGRAVCTAELDRLDDIA